MQQVWLLLLERCGTQIAKSLAETETRYQTLKYTHKAAYIISRKGMTTCGNAG